MANSTENLNEKPASNAVERTRLIAAATTVWSLCAALYAAYLSVVKFQSDHTCRAGLFSACTAASLPCDDVFRGFGSSFLGLPTTIYATSFYAVVAAIAAAAALKPEASHAARRGVAVLGWISLAVTAVMMSIALIFHGHLCLYCAGLYLASAGLAMLGAGLNRQLGLGIVAGPNAETAASPPGDGETQAKARAADTVRPHGLIGLGIVSFGLLTVLTQATIWSREVRIAERKLTARVAGPSGENENEDDCGVLVPDFGTPSLVLGADADKGAAEFALFVDPSCPHCREEATQLEALHREGSWRAKVHVYMYPRDPGAYAGTRNRCDQKNSVLSLPGAVAMRACNAALFVTCAGLVDHSSATEAFWAIWRLHDQAQSGRDESDREAFSDLHLARIAEEIGLASERQGEAWVQSCYQNDKAYQIVQESLLVGSRSIAGSLADSREGAGSQKVVDGVPTLYLLGPHAKTLNGQRAARRIEGSKDKRVLRHLLTGVEGL